MNSWRLIPLFVLLSACVTQKPLPDVGSWPLQQQEIMSITDWQVRGRVALAVGEEGGKGRITWQQQGANIDLSFRGPFGAGAFRVFGDLDQLTLTTKEGDSYLSNRPEYDLEQQVGWSVPVKSLGYWVRGLPDPNQPLQSSQVAENGLLESLSQDGWQVTYSLYREYEGRVLPRKLSMTGKNVKIKMAVDNWRLPAS